VFPSIQGNAAIRESRRLVSDQRQHNKEALIIGSLQYLTNDKRIELNAFVIMSNHIHLIWQALKGFTPSGVQASFMKYTAQQIKHSLTKYNSGMLAGLKVNKI
jgi:REP element-mobilizing transposase RayT